MKKRLLALLLTACMLISILPAGVFATDDAESEGVLSHRQINPVFENVLSEEAKAEILAELDEIAAQEPEVVADEMQGYVSESQMISTLKTNMINRVSSLYVQFYTTKNPNTTTVISDAVLKACDHDGVANHGDYIFWSNGGTGWDGNFSKSGSYYYITLTFSFAWNATAYQETQVTNAVNNLVRNTTFPANTPTAYKVKTIYNWICQNVTYDHYHLDTNPTGYRIMYSAYGAIIDRTCVCQGYALLLYRLLLSYGINTRIVTSYDHAWNIVKMGNYWYYADTTWDAGYSYNSWDYFLAGTRTFDGTNYNVHHVRENGTSYGGYDYRYGSAFDRAHPMAYNDYAMSACELNNHNFKSTVTKSPSTYENGSKVSTCTRCGLSFTEAVPCTGYNPFKDVPSSQYYYAPVVWAYNTGVASGTGSTTFSPNATCTRAQVVAFLWRAAGKPEPATTYNPFTDVKKSDYFYKAVLWASENGIVYGTSTTTFGPNDGCTRAQVAAFLWRAKGKPSPSSSSNPFTDVKSSAYYAKAVTWAAENKIVYGTSNTTFSPDQSCTRAQIVTFLYRAYYLYK
ncbi:MAG: S-layer homology domain-containing protein [Oscillospiraceae bacterium]|nr:S-layer homology domain-containing protein [Oscillospiraceae bacterium]